MDEEEPKKPAPIAADDFAWIEEMREKFGGVDVGGPPPPEPCKVCGRPVDLSDAELYATPRRKRCRPCLAEAARERRVRLVGATIPPRYEDAVLGSVALVARIRCGPPSPERVEAILRAPRVVFVGATKSGKTTLACAMLREAARRGSEAMYASAHRLANARAGHHLGDGEPPMVASAISADLLLIDEVGGERQTEMSDLRYVVWERYDHERPIWITTGLSCGSRDELSAKIASAYDGGFAARVVEDAAIVRCDGKPGPAR